MKKRTVEITQQAGRRRNATLSRVCVCFHFHMVFIWGGGLHNYSGISRRGDSGRVSAPLACVLTAVRNNHLHVCLFFGPLQGGDPNTFSSTDPSLLKPAEISLSFFGSAAQHKHNVKTYVITGSNTSLHPDTTDVQTLLL